MRALLLVSVLLAVACGGDDDDTSGAPDAAPTADECHEWRGRPETSWNSCDADFDGDGISDFRCLDVLAAPDGTFGCVRLAPENPGGCEWVTCTEVM